jgi:hypothetical protein
VLHSKSGLFLSNYPSRLLSAQKILDYTDDTPVSKYRCIHISVHLARPNLQNAETNKYS